MLADEGTIGHWFIAKANRVPTLVWWILAVCVCVDWRALREHGLLVGLKKSLFELLQLLPSEIIPVLFVVSAVLAAGFIKRHGARNIGLRCGSFFSRLRHDRVAN